jgi:hypothetical protein
MPPNKADVLKKPMPVRWQSVLMLAFGTAACLPIAAEAQYYGRWGGGYGPYGYYDGGPYGGPPPYYSEEEGPGPGYRGGGYDGPRAPSGSSAHPPASQSTDLVPVDLIRKRIIAAGYRLIAEPRHKGNIYLAEVEDKNAIRHRLVYDAHDGHLIENTALGPVKKLSLPPQESSLPKTQEPTHATNQSEPKLIEPAGEAKSDGQAMPGDTAKEPDTSKTAMPTEDAIAPPPANGPSDVR